ncbi:sugar phosphate isomerase/epimerase family protein [Streptomyces purpurogeneiscleroticus]|uniref:sugar phosphate isomerase/epimerase family protein n=1 Tax=Streptomyces purpurogeneiscleroticus TaxID=68259 RepID=UPI001CBE49E4|nr:sugar phosphate isomerase/epimerase family protein [Streptomyces purpurogeneiscleroticus]MBZ4020226.1 xylose isomerase [Streptomyces purpurogeneiscleroticus]
MSADAFSVTDGRLPGIRYAGIGDEAAPDLPGQLEALRRLGWPSIELRTVDGTAIADLNDHAFARLAGGLDAAGVDVVCVDSRIANWARPITGRFEDDLDELRILARRCATLGTRYIRVMSYPNAGLSEADWGRRALRRMTNLVHEAEQHGLVLLHENCSGWAGTRADRMLDLLQHVDNPALRLLFDIGNGVPYGYDARAVLDAVIGHVAHVHVKDARPRAGDQVDYTLPGDGESGVRECLTALLRHGYTGAWSIEPHTHLRPHDDHNATDDDGIAAFVRYGRSLERLVQSVQQEVTAASVVTADDGGARA